MVSKKEKSSSPDWQQLGNNYEIKKFLAVRGIKWTFIPTHSPWYGGFYERIIKVIKTFMKKQLNVSDEKEEMLVKMKEIEAMVNDRPLMEYFDDDEKSHFIVTPRWLSTGLRTQFHPFGQWEANADFQKLDLKSYCKEVQKYHQKIWQWWLQTYGDALKMKAKKIKTRYNPWQPELEQLILIKRYDRPIRS